MKKFLLTILVLVFASNLFAVGEGQGTAVISPKQATSGSTRDYTITYTDGITAWSNGRLYVSIPSGGWSGMQFDQTAPGGVSVTAIGATGLTWSTNGKTISITAATMPALTGKIIITYKLAMAGFTGGYNYFYIKSDPDGGAGAYIGTSPSVLLAGTPTATKTATKTNTPAITSSSTKTVTPTNTPEDTRTITPTLTVTPTLTESPAISPSFTPTNTPSPTSTDVNSSTATKTITRTNSQTPTFTATRTITQTSTVTPTATVTKTPAVAGYAVPTDPNGLPYDFNVNVNYANPFGMRWLYFGAGKSISITASNGQRIFVESLTITNPTGISFYMTGSTDTTKLNFLADSKAVLPVKWLYGYAENVYFYTTESDTDAAGIISYRIQPYTKP